MPNRPSYGVKEEIYMRQPKGFKDGDWKIFVWLMLHSIYGLKQSTLKWYEQVRAVMADPGFLCCESNHALFYYDEVNVAAGKVHTCCLIRWHIDYGMAISNSRPFLEWVKLVFKGPVTVTPKTIPITNPKLWRHNHPWELHLALVRPNRVLALGYKSVPGSCDLTQGLWRYDHFKSVIPLEQLLDF